MRSKSAGMVPYQDEACLAPYGMSRETVDSVFGSIIQWLEGHMLPWNKSRYVSAFAGPDGSSVVELMFFHFEGPAGREIGSGGETNNCRIYLYADRCSVSFVAEPPEIECGLSFKYTTRWVQTNKALLRFLVTYLEGYLLEVFETDPARFSGRDRNLETVRSIIGVMAGVLKGQIVI